MYLELVIVYSFLRVLVRLHIGIDWDQHAAIYN